MDLGIAVQRHPDDDAVVGRAVADTPAEGHVHGVVGQNQCSALVLRLRIEAAIGQRHGRPDRIPGVDVNRDQLVGRRRWIDLDRRKQPSGRRIDHRRTGDADRIDVSAAGCQVGVRDRRAGVELPALGT